MNRMLSSAAVVVACALSGCDSASPTAAELVVGGVQLQNVGGVQQSATGSGHYTSGGEIRTFSFSAIKHANRSVSGDYQLDVHAADLVLRVNFTCMDVVENTAF